MVWLILAVAIVLVVLTVAAVLGRVDGALADPTTTMSHVPLPEDRLTPGDLDGLRFDTAMRGYRMGQVDATLDRLRREIADLEAALGSPAEPPGLVERAEATDPVDGAVDGARDPDGPPEVSDQHAVPEADPQTGVVPAAVDSP